MLRRLATFLFNRGYISSSLKLLNNNDSLGSGSSNLIFTGTGVNRVFKGISQRSTIVGSRTLMNVGDSYGGLGNATDSSALGSVFRVLGALFYIGTGRLFYNGADAGVSATSTLKLKKVVSGALGTQYDAGLPQSSAAIIKAIAPPTGFTGKNDGTVSVKLTRIRSATGARSIASETSNIVVCRNESVLVQFPGVSSNGQDYWEIYATYNGFGGQGNHYFLKEVAEADVVGSITATATAVDSTTIKVANNVVYPSTGSSPTDNLSSKQIGFKVEGAYQWKYITVQVDPSAGAGDIKSVVTANGSTLATVTATITASSTATQVAEELYDALNISTITNVFNLYRDGATVYLRNTGAADDTMNFTLQAADSPATPATNITWVTTASTGSIKTWITAVGADDSGGSGYREITLNGTIGVYPTASETVTITNAVAGITRSVAIEWNDGDLAGAELAPIYDYPPPAALFGGVIGDVVFVDGALGDNANVVTGTSTATPTYVGNAIAISEPTRPESFAPDNYIFTNDAPVALLAGSQGLYWRFGKNSLGVIRYIGNRPALSYERLWTGMGIQNQNNCTLAGGGRLYAYTGARGAIRVGGEGEPDTFFAAPVADDMAGWTPANVVLGYDANYQYVFYAHNQTMLAYFEPMDIWCAPLDLSATLGAKTIKAMVTYNSEVYIAAGDNSGINLYSFNTGTGTTATLATQWQESVTESDILSRIKIGLTSDTAATSTMSYYTNGIETPVLTQTFDVRTGLQIPTTLRPNVRNAKMWKMHGTLTSTGGNAGWQNIIVDGDSSGITI